MKKSFLCAFFLLCILLVSSCLDGREEFWFERNGSGRIEAEYHLPVFAVATMGGEAKLQKTIEDFFAKEEGMTMDHFSLVYKDSAAVMTIKARFDSVVDLTKLFEKSTKPGDPKMPDPMMKLLGEVEVKRDGMSVALNRKIDARQVFGGGLLAPSRDQLKGHSLQYIIHLPTKATSSNAQETQDDGKTLRWNYSLMQAMESPVETNFTTPIPIPWWAWLAVLVLLIMAALGLKWLLKKRRSNIQPIG
jgi:hypothetical protein